MPLAIDELPLVALAACFAEGETTIRDAAELRRKESDRIETVAAALTALGGRGRDERGRDADRGHGRLARRRDRLPRRPPDRDARRDRRPRLARGRRGRGDGRRRGQLSGLRGRPRLARAAAESPRIRSAMVIAIDGPAGAGKSSVARGSPPRSASPTSTPGRCIAAWRWPRWSPAPTSTTPRRWPAGRRAGDRARRERVGSTGATSTAAIREPRVTAAASRVSVHPAVREAMVDRQRRADRRRPLRRRGPRHRHRGQPRGAAQGLPHRLRRGARPPPRRAERRGRGGGARRPAPSATRATTSASTAPCAPPPTRSSSTPPAWPSPRSSRASSTWPASGAWREPSASPSCRYADEKSPRESGRVSRPPTVAVVGFPNVGKSTLVNRLAGGREAVTACRAGGHPRPQAGRAASGTASPSSCSTPAASTSRTRPSWPRDVQRQARIGIAEADAMLLVVDGRAGLRAGDAELAKTLRGGGGAGAGRRQQSRPPRRRAPDRRVPRLGLGEPIARLGHATGSAAATCSTGSSSCSASCRRRRRATTRSTSP